MFLLDTNVVSELRKVGDGTANARVIKWVSGQDASALFISALIAATAMVHGMTVVTGNRTDFEASGVAFIDPWAEC